jgi:rare lipoprotein A
MTTPLRTITAALTLTCLLVLAGCSTTRTRGGGYYKDDGPGAHPPSNIDAIPDAVPRIETHSSATSKPYVVFGKRYVPLSSDRPFRQRGIASWYGKKFHGAKTSNGETYDMYAMTAAHPTLPIPSYARVTRVGSGKSVIVRINDRGPFHSSRIMDLSYVAAAKLGIIGPGSGEVIVDAITNQDIARGETHIDDIAAAGGTIPETAPATAVAVAEPTPNVMAALQGTREDASSTPPDPISNEAAPATPTPQFARAPESTPANTPRPALLAYSDNSAQAMNVGNNQIYLQFGAFSGSENAQHMAQKLNQKIGQIESRPVRVETDNNLFRVQIGPYPNRTAAVNAAVRIQQETGAQSTIAVR